MDYSILIQRVLNRTRTSQKNKKINLIVMKEKIVKILKISKKLNANKRIVVAKARVVLREMRVKGEVL